MAASLGVVFAVSAFAYRHYTHPDRIRRLSEAYLQGFFQTPVSVGGARFSLFHQLQLFDVAVESPAAGGGPTEPAFACRRIDLGHDVGAALLGRLRISSLVATAPTCHVIHDASTGTTNLAGLFRSVVGMAPGDIDELPPVELRDARVRVVSRTAEGAREIENLHVSVRGRASSRIPGSYDLVWHGEEPGSGTGYSRLDLRNGEIRNVAGGLPFMSIEAVMLAVNAKYDGVGAWVSLFGLDGRVRVADYDLTGTTGGVGVRAARVDLRDASLSIPIDDEEESLPRDQRYLFFEHVNGSITATEEDIRADFVAELRGGSCEVRATVRGAVVELRTLEDVELELSVSAKGLEFPRPDSESDPPQSRFVNRWKRMANFYDEFDPCGKFDLEVEAEKAAGSGGAARLRRAVVKPRGASASCKWFPYRLREVTGTVEVDDRGVMVTDIRAEHDGGAATINGWLAAPSRCAAGEFWIRGDRIPIDEQLIGALTPGQARLVRSFDACGRVDIDTEMHRAGCDGRGKNPWSIHTDISPDGVSVSYDAFPYRVDGIRGLISLDPRSLDVRHVRGVAGSALVAAEGAGLMRDGALSDLELVVRALDVPLDGHLLWALPFDDRLAVQALRPKGSVDVETRVRYAEGSGRSRVETLVGLNGVALHPEAFPVAFNNVYGVVRAADGDVRFDGLSGTRGESILRASGWARRDDERKHSLNVVAERLVVDDELRGALPPAFSTSIGDWHMVTPVNVDLSLQDDGTSIHYAIRAAVTDGVATHPRLAVPLEHIDGRLALSRDRISVSGFSARLGPASLRGGYEQVVAPGGVTGLLTLTAADLPLDQPLSSFLPDRLRLTWDRLAPSGSVDVELQPLRLDRRRGEGSSWTVDARLRIRGLGLGSVSSLENIDADVSARGAVFDRLGGLNLSGEVSQARMKVRDREMHDVSAAWRAVRTAAGVGHFSLENIQAGLYDGTALGELAVETGAGGATYRLNTSLQGVDLGRLLYGEESSLGGTEAVGVHGATNAHFYLSGVIGDVASRRGGGKFEVLRGYIHRLPIVLAVWNVLNATIPNQDTFDAIQGSFFINGQVAEVESLRVGGGTVSLTGSGEYFLRDQSVDIELKSTNKAGWARVPGLTDMVEGASRELVVLHVAGPISSPVVTVQAMRGVNEELKQLFRKRPPPPIQPSR